MERLIEITKEFKREGYEFYLVGGSVRDHILGIESNDYDFCTDALPPETERILSRFGDVYKIGEKFGTIGCHVPFKVEVTTYRTERYSSDSRNPVVEYSTSLIEDLSRRDFTVNSIAWDLDSGEIVDPFNGIEDIFRRTISCPSDPNVAFKEDPLRLMRAIRFSNKFNFYITKETKVAILYNSSRLSIVKKERIADELGKILLLDNPSNGVRDLVDFGLMNYIVPEFLALRELSQGKHHMKDAEEHTYMVMDNSRIKTIPFMLSCFLHDIGKPKTYTNDGKDTHFYSHQFVGAEMAKEILSRLRFDGDTIDFVYTLIQFHMTPIGLYEDFEKGNIKLSTVKRIIRKVGEDRVPFLVELVRCDLRGTNDRRDRFFNAISSMFNKALEDKPCEIESPLDGNTIMKEFNLKPSKLIGEIKDYLIELVIEGEPFDPIERIRNFLRERGEYVK
jgi:poly(A) polymerase